MTGVQTCALPIGVGFCVGFIDGEGLAEGFCVGLLPVVPPVFVPGVCEGETDGEGATADGETLAPGTGEGRPDGEALASGLAEGDSDGKALVSGVPVSSASRSKKLTVYDTGVLRPVISTLNISPALYSIPLPGLNIMQPFCP